MKINVHAVIEIPTPPSYFRMEGGQTIPISAITEDGLYEIGKQWTEALIKRSEDLLSDASTFYEADAAKGRALLTEWLCANSNFDMGNWALRVRNFIEDESEQDDA